MNLKLSFNPKALLGFLSRIKGFAFTLALIGTFGYTGYQMLPLLELTPDEAAKEALIAEAAKKAVKLDTKTLEATKAQTRVPVKPDTSAVGKPDPFSP